MTNDEASNDEGNPNDEVRKPQPARMPRKGPPARPRHGRGKQQSRMSTPLGFSSRSPRSSGEPRHDSSGRPRIIRISAFGLLSDLGISSFVIPSACGDSSAANSGYALLCLTPPSSRETTMKSIWTRVIIVAAVLALLGVVILAKQAAKPKDDAIRLKPGLPAVLDFGRGQCQMCKMMIPVIEELKKELAGKVEVHLVDIGEHPAMTEQFKIEIIPTQVFLDASGKEVHRHEGFMPKEDILAKLSEMGVK
ncbi:MAG: thioredoxin family protein [Planctomycetes bacterium]|nr:thioredoxin family protein [Planctomycetota bacterium]